MPLGGPFPERDAMSGDFGSPADGVDERIKPELVPGERLLWSARSEPKPGGIDSPRGFAWALGIGLPGIAAFVHASRIGETVQPAFAWLMLFGFPAMVIGALTLVGSLVAVSGQRRQIRQQRLQCYALTDRRAILWLPEPGSGAMIVQSFPLSAIKPEAIRRSQFPDGTGSVLLSDLEFGPSGFLAIEDARRVEWLLRELIGAPIDDRAG